MSGLPAGWEVSSLGTLGPDISYGFTTASTVVNRHPKLLRITDITDDGVDWSTVPYCTDEPPARSLLRRGDIVIARTGATTGKSFLIDSVDGDVVFASYLIRVRISDELSPEYVQKFMQSDAYWDQISIVSKGTAQPGANASILSKVSIPLAPKEAQRRIVAKIDRLSARSKRAREELEQVNLVVGRFKKETLAAAFCGRLTADWRTEHPSTSWSSDDWGRLNLRRREYLATRRGARLEIEVSEARGSEPLPSDWFPAILADVAAIQVGYAFKSAWYTKEGVRLLRGANIAPQSVTWEDEVRLDPQWAAQYEDFILKVGDIVLAMDRPLIAAGLKVAKITECDAGSLLVQRVARLNHSSYLHDGFLWLVINSHLFIDHAIARSTGTDLPHISANDILTTKVPLPGLDEQREIVRRIEHAFAAIDRLAAEATSARKLLDRLDQAVLAKAFRGELVPQDPNDEPASVLLERIHADRATSPPL